MSGVVGPRLSTIPPTFFNDYSFEFDGTDDVVVINNTLGITNGLTMSCWVKFATTITSTNWLCSAGGTGGSNGHFNTRLAANGVWVNYLNGGAFFVFGLDSTALKDGNWHHIAQTIDYSNAEMRFYQDGVESTSIRAINTGTTTTKINQIGGASSTPVYPFTGNIDEFAILEGAKTLTEIQEIYNSGIPTDLTPLNPISWYRMGDNGTYKDPQWLIPSNENKDKVSNYSMSFDGTDDYVDCGTSIGDSLGDNYTGDLSVSLWFKTNIVTPANDGIFSIGDFANSVGEFTISIYNNTLNYRLNNGAWIRTVAFTDTTSWHHLLVIYKSGSEADSKMFLDGADVGTASGTFPTTSLMDFAGLKTTIGAYYSQAFVANGNIDEVAIFNNDQTANAADIYNLGVPTDISSLSPLAWYRMGENATLKDPQWLILNNENKDKFSNYSMSFDGTNDGFLMAADSALTLSGAFSISIWMKGTVSSSCYLFSRQFMYVQHTGVNKIRMRTFENGGSYQTVETGTVNIYDDNWHHILITYQIGGNASIYLDGVLKTNPVVTQLGFVGGAIPIGIGTDYLGSGSFFTGQIDDIAFWHNTDVSSSVSTIYNGGTPNDLTSLSPSVWLKAGDDATYNFSTSGWTMTNNGTTGIYDAESINMDINDRVGEAPGSSENTVSYNMDINDRVGDAPNSENNALSYNMVLSGRTSDVPT